MSMPWYKDGDKSRDQKYTAYRCGGAGRMTGTVISPRPVSLRGVVGVKVNKMDDIGLSRSRCCHDYISGDSRVAG